MKTTPEQRAGIKQCQHGVWHDENCERCISEDRHEIEKDELRAELAATRKQLVEAQADNAAMHSAAHRLALEAECFYMDCKDMALISKWDDHLQTAISDVQSLQWSGDTSALSSAIAEAVEPYKLDADRYQQLRRGQHWSVINGIGEDLRADELDAAIDAIAAKEAP